MRANQQVKEAARTPINCSSVLRVKQTRIHSVKGQREGDISSSWGPQQKFQRPGYIRVESGKGGRRLPSTQRAFQVEETVREKAREG